MTIFVRSAACALCLAAPATMAAVAEHQAVARATLEELRLPGGERMGLAGTSYLLALGDWFYGGMSVYSAVSGKRGGFFTGGLTAGLRHHLSEHLAIDAGLFVGGGGGGAAPQGGGLMLRPHAGLMLDTPIGLLGVQASRVKFPNGGIDSSQLAFTYEYPLTALYGGGWLNDAPRALGGDLFRHAYVPRGRDLSALALVYQPAAGSRGRSGVLLDGRMELAGAQWDHALGQHTYFAMSAAGAAGGSTDGFAQVLFGGGLRLDLPWRNSLRLQADLGAAGGGNVDTGGGVVAKLSAGLDHRFRSGLLLGLEGGYIEAPGGDFRASTVGLRVGYSYDGPSALRRVGAETPLADDTRYGPRHWRLRFAHQSYFPDSGVRRKSGAADHRVDLVGMQLDAMVNDYLYLSGQAYGAYAGGAGGFAAGLVGGGAVVPLWHDSRLFVNPELLVGAGGGGSLKVGGGLIGEARLGLGYRLNRSLALIASGGRLMSKSDGYRANTFQLALSYRFSTLERAR